MKSWLFCWIVFASVVFGAELSLQERLVRAKKGDYIVMEANKMTTLLALRDITSESILIEEITIPTQNLKKTSHCWADWVKTKAPGHTSWSMIEIDLAKGEVLECYSFSKNSWIHLSPKESLFATLIHLPMKNVPKDQQKKIGPPPMSGEPDVRKVWVPPLIREGEKVDAPKFDIYETLWPEDGTEIGGREVVLYFDAAKQSPFPFWIQAETTHATAALRSIDSGKNLPAIHRDIPRRVPEFIGHPIKTEKGLRFSLKSPKYYQKFDLFAVDVTTRERQLCPITHTLIQESDEQLTILVDQQELEANLEPRHRYTWLLVPVGRTEFYTETTKPFSWL